MFHSSYYGILMTECKMVSSLEPINKLDNRICVDLSGLKGRHVPWKILLTIILLLQRKFLCFGRFSGDGMMFILDGLRVDVRENPDINPSVPMNGFEGYARNRGSSVLIVPSAVCFQ